MKIKGFTVNVAETLNFKAPRTKPKGRVVQLEVPVKNV